MEIFQGWKTQAISYKMQPNPFYNHPKSYSHGLYQSFSRKIAQV